MGNSIQEFPERSLVFEFLLCGNLELNADVLSAPGPL